MPSEREHRLHPSAVALGVLGHLKSMVLPAGLVVFGALRGGGDWLVWLVVVLAVLLALALVQYLAFRYRYAAGELVIRKGVLFRSERHVPYARIQSLDTVQNVVHRALGVVEVRVQTGGGDEPEAVLAAISGTSLEEMRRRVFERRGVDQPTDSLAPEPPALLALSVPEVLLTGLVEVRGLALIATGFGVLWESGILDPLLELMFGEPKIGRRMIRDVIEWVGGSGVVEPARIAMMAGALLGFVVALSGAWALVRLYGFTLRRRGEDLHTEHGLVTRLTAATPARRIQTLSIRSGPVHQVFRRITVEAETAGGTGATSGSERLRLAPILRPADLGALLAKVVPDLQLDHLDWQPLGERATRRVFARFVLMSMPVAALSAIWLGAWALAVLAVLAAVSALHAWQYVRHARWAMDDSMVAFERGWIWKRTTVARLSKIQVVTVAESPLDRRHAMAGLGVDTAGATVDIPFLARATADSLQARLATSAAGTEFRW